MRAHVALATCRRLGGLDADDAILAHEIERRGGRVAAPSWNDAGVDWLAYDAVLVRSAWDYVADIAGYRAWLDTLAEIETRGCAVFNAPALMRQNIDKRYLLALEARGVPIVPTALLEQGQSLAELVESRGFGEVVVKPVVSAGAHETFRASAPITRRDERLAHKAAVIDGAALVQPYLDEIASGGELSLIYIDGRASHAVRKRPAAGDFRVQEQFGGACEPLAFDATLRAAGERALAAIDGEVPLYARVDGVVRDGELLLMELELTEPSLFFGHAPASAGRLADALLARISRRRAAPA
ncbi:MAG: hypothetical protein KC503_04355 [Myxococcales bacterium]|nr:hypothetical protein [Myxococcales bacterium]